MIRRIVSGDEEDIHLLKDLFSFSGNTIKTRNDTRIIDIAPTILHMLGISKVGLTKLQHPTMQQGL